MNDTEREQWIDNDEGLYNWWRGTRPRISKRAFVRENRAEITAAIERVTNGNKPAHHLAYEGRTPLPWSEIDRRARLDSPKYRT